MDVNPEKRTITYAEKDIAFIPFPKGASNPVDLDRISEVMSEVMGANNRWAHRDLSEFPAGSDANAARAQKERALAVTQQALGALRPFIPEVVGIGDEAEAFINPGMA